MRYAQIRDMDISNGESIGVALFVQGCDFHCHNCFNEETWDFNGGKEWTDEIENKFIKLASRPYVKRISILGGEPLHKNNLESVSNLVNKIQLLFPEKRIWLYTGFEWEDITMKCGEVVHNHNGLKFDRHNIVEQCDVVVVGRYVDELRDLSLKWRGSSNQRVVNVQESLKWENHLTNNVIMYCD